MKSIEQTLLSLNVNEHTEKKNGLTYLSWAWAWAEALKIDPAASFTVKTFTVESDTLANRTSCYMSVGETAMVWVTVTLGGRDRECFLPVMDHRNRPIANPDAFQVNTALMRCLTKCLALFGLGLYIYAGEDLPETSEAPTSDKGPAAKKPVSDGLPEIDLDADSPGSTSLVNLQFFAEKLLENLPLHNTEAALRSYWKANVEGIERLKKHNEDLFTSVQIKFSEAKKEAQNA